MKSIPYPISLFAEWRVIGFYTFLGVGSKRLVIKI